MGPELRPATADDLEAIVAADGRAFSIAYTPQDVAAIRDVLDLDRFHVVVDHGDVVGVAGSYAKELTLPGGALVPTAAVTWVSVAVTHRRRGLLRRLMTAVHADAADRGEPLLALTASEGGIYGRFGYGVATTIPVTSIDRHRARFVTATPPLGSVRLVPTAGAAPVLAAGWDRYRRGQPGEVSRDEAWYRLLLQSWGAGAVVAVHADGHIVWTVEPDWNDGHPRHRLTIRDLAAATPEAHSHLWATALSVDLVGTVKAVGMLAPDDALPVLLEDPRAVRTTDLVDHVWLRPADPARCFGLRAYRLDDRLVLQVDDPPGSPVRFAVGGGAPGEATEETPDLVVDRAGAGSLLLGGTAPSVLARAGRLRARSADVLARADALLGWDPVAHCRSSF
jgi:predicted acetyltransferase